MDDTGEPDDRGDLDSLVRALNAAGDTAAVSRASEATARLERWLAELEKLLSV